MMIVLKTKVRVDDEDDEVDDDKHDDDDESQNRIRNDGGEDEVDHDEEDKGRHRRSHSKTIRVVGDEDPSRSRRRRPLRRHDPKRNVKNPIGTAAAARTRIPNPTSGHLKVNILIGPLDT